MMKAPPPAQQQSVAKEFYQNDHWTLTDSLGLGAVADHVAAIALQSNPPFTIGVAGKWGAGKTSILRRSYVTLGGLPIEQPLAFSSTPQCDINTENTLVYTTPNRQPPLDWSPEVTASAAQCFCVWFSPWQHQNEQNPLIPLLMEIQRQFSTWHKIKTAAGQVNRRGGLAAAALIERVIDGGFSLFSGKNVKAATGTTEAMTKAWREAEPNVLQPSDGQRFHLLFEDAVNAVLGAANDSETVQSSARMVIFIDDLDRCEERVIVQLLEAIKLYLNSQRCVFVLGLDDSAVMAALGRIWQRSEDLNREYLEKLFQVRILVPLPQPASITQSIVKQLDLHGIAYSAVLAEDIEKLLEPNPRKVKNFVNGLCAAWRLFAVKDWFGADAPETNKKNEARKFVLFHYIQQYHRAIWRLLERQPNTLPLLTAALIGGEMSQLAQGYANADGSQGIKSDDQRLLFEIFRRAFSHILANINEDLVNKHNNENLDSAVEQFLHRQDRKRSDEYLRDMFRQCVTAEEVLNNKYLHAAALDNTNNGPKP